MHTYFTFIVHMHLMMCKIIIHWHSILIKLFLINYTFISICLNLVLRSVPCMRKVQNFALGWGCLMTWMTRPCWLVCQIDSQVEVAKLVCMLVQNLLSKTEHSRIYLNHMKNISWLRKRNKKYTYFKQINKPINHAMSSCVITTFNTTKKSGKVKSNHQFAVIL